MIKFNIVTRCTRPQFLSQVKSSIFTTTNFDIKWWVVFDTRVVKDIDGKFLSDLQLLGGTALFFEGVEGDFAHSLLSKTLELIQDGFVYFLDDDNILHEDFWTQMSTSIKKNPEKLGFIFNQKISGKDFTGQDIRFAGPQNTKVQHIDMAQFVIHRSLIGENRFVPGDYTADGQFIERIFNKNQNDFLFIDEILCYYNCLKTPSNFTPKVLYIGEDQPVLKSRKFADWESDDLRVIYKHDDKELQKILLDFNPDAIITQGPTWEKYLNLGRSPLDVRSRWVHIENSDDSTGEIAYNCSMGYILNKEINKTLISYFTPIYNLGKKLLQTYQSLKNQTNPDWEWVIVNDSTDGGLTLKVAEELAQCDNRVKVYDFRIKSGGIVGESKYRAAHLTSGEVLVELDHDDYLMPTATDTILNAYKKYPECGFYYTDCSELDNNWNSLTYGDGFAFGYGKYRDEIVFGKPTKVCESLNINPKTIRHIVGVPNHIRAWRRDVYFQTRGHNRRLSIADDYELVIRTFLITKFLKIPRLEYLQFIHNDGNNTHNLSRADIQRRVRTISNHYNEKIKLRFEELGVEDWAYKSNPQNPTFAESKFGKEEGYVNLIWEN